MGRKVNDKANKVLLKTDFSVIQYPIFRVLWIIIIREL